MAECPCARLGILTTENDFKERMGCAEGGRAASLQAAQAPGTLSPVMGTIALRGMAYAEDVNFGCVASAASAECVRPG